MDELEIFEHERPRLRSIAQRMLGGTGGAADADDVLQEAWLRLDRTDAGAIDNLPGWLTTVVSRLCLDRLRAARPQAASAVEVRADDGPGPERDAEQADAVTVALQVVLATLSPAERLAFVLHDLFGLPFEEVGAVMGRSQAATRQLASRARRRVRGGADSAAEAVAAQEAAAERRTQQRVVRAFFAASREGDLRTLVALLDPQAVIRADAASVRLGAAPILEGADAVAGRFSGGARAARPAEIDGYAGAVWSHLGDLKVAFGFTLDESGRIVEIEMIGDAEVLASLDWHPVSQRAR